MFSTSTKAAANTTKDLALNDLKEKGHDIKLETRKIAENKIDNLTEYANEAGRKVRELVDTASEELSTASNKITVEIRNNPIRSSLIALGAGFILGALFRR